MPEFSWCKAWALGAANDPAQGSKWCKLDEVIFAVHHFDSIEACAGYGDLGASALFELSSPCYGVNSMSQQLKLLLLSAVLLCGGVGAETDPLIIDVRTTLEWSAGHLESAQHLELGSVADHIGRLAEHKDQAILLYCRSGNRSGQAKVILEGLGYTNVVNAGGLEDASRKLGQEIIYPN
jgi:phage shock protein E